jgi:rubrerythrin
MGLLKKEPAGRIASAEELMAVAHALEREAAGRYRDLSHRMRLQGEEDLAELFAFLSRIEEKHAERVDERTRAIVGKPPDPARVRWELPEHFDEESGRSYLLTPYRALAIAVRNEERAFAFFSYLAAGAEDQRIRRLAEEFAKDELDHAALLRRERRKAWRLEGRADPFVERLEMPGSLAELRAQAAGMERAMAQGHGTLSAALRETGDTQKADLFEEAASDERACAEEVETRLARRGAALRLRKPPASVVDGLRLLEFAFESYSGVVERARDEQILREAQALAERALRRLARVQGTIGNTLLAGIPAAG